MYGVLLHDIATGDGSVRFESASPSVVAALNRIRSSDGTRDGLSAGAIAAIMSSDC